MEQKKTQEQILERIQEQRYLRHGRSFEDLEGKPTGNPMSRHRCKYCKSRKYEKDLEIPEFATVGSNNYKSWINWQCKDRVKCIDRSL